MNQRILIIIAPIILLMAFLTESCGNISASLPAHFYSNVTVSWSANHENSVNAPGGGYRIYFSTTPGFSVNGASYVDVPYSSTTSSVPTTATLNHLPPGKYHLKIVAYAALNQPGSTTGGAVSPASQEVVVSIP